MRKDEDTTVRDALEEEEEEDAMLRSVGGRDTVMRASAIVDREAATASEGGGRWAAEDCKGRCAVGGGNTCALSGERPASMHCARTRAA